jgi:carboxylesterase type B
MREDLVVVTVEYRLGALGTLTSSPATGHHSRLKGQSHEIIWAKNGELG